MGQKRKNEITVVEENDRVLYTMFQKAAENLTDLYTQRVNQQQHAFEAGKMSAYENLHRWILEKLQLGEMVTVKQIFAYLQDKMNCTPGGSQQAGDSPGDQTEQPGSSSAGTNLCADNYPDMEMETVSDERTD